MLTRVIHAIQSSLKVKFVLSILGLVTLGQIFVAFMTTHLAESMQKTIIDQWISDDARAESNLIEKYFNGFLYLGKGLATQALTLKDLPDADKERALDKTTKELLLAHPGIRCAYFIFERGKYFSIERTSEGKVMSISWYRTKNGELKQDGANGDWEMHESDEYWYGPKAAKKEYLTSAYKYLYAGESDSLLMSSVVIPVMENGEFIGVVGFDITVDDLWNNIVSKIKPMDEGYAILVDNAGIRAGHPKKELRGTKIGSDMKPETQEKLIAAIQKGEFYTVDKKAAATGKMSHIFYQPIRFGETDTYWSLGLVFPMDLINQPILKLRNFGILSTVIMLILLSLILLYLARSVVRPIQNASALMHDIASGEGDLTQRLPVSSKDEIGALAQNFNTFAEKVRQIVAEVQTNTIQVEKAAQDMSGNAQTMSHVSGDMSEQTQRVVAAMEQSSASTGIVSSSVQTLSDSVSSVTAAIEEMTISLKTVAERCQEEYRMANDAQTRAGNVTQSMDQLNNAAMEIGRVLDMIEDIAEQINLLALNATIEAATAGEAGKGFAVVAGEVKQLAHQTANATEKISKQIQEIQSCVSGSIRDIQGITQVIGSVNNISRDIVGSVEEQSTTMKSIAESVTSVNTDAGKISQNVKEISQGIQEVAGRASELGAASQSTASHAKVTESAPQKLSSLADKLKGLAGRFKV